MTIRTFLMQRDLQADYFQTNKINELWIRHVVLDQDSFFLMVQTVTQILKRSPGNSQHQHFQTFSLIQNA